MKEQKETNLDNNIIQKKIKKDTGVLFLLLIFSIVSIMNVIDLPRESYASPEMPGYLAVPIFIWISTVWIGVRLYNNQKKTKRDNKR
jgi:hypothetical protein